MVKAGLYIDVAGDGRVLFQRLGPTHHGFCHLHCVHTAPGFVADVDDGFGGMGEHGGHLMPVGDGRIDIRGKHH